MRIYARVATSAQNFVHVRSMSSLKNLTRRVFGYLFQKTRINVKNVEYVL